MLLLLLLNCKAWDEATLSKATLAISCCGASFSEAKNASSAITVGGTSRA